MIGDPVVDAWLRTVSLYAHFLETHLPVEWIAPPAPIQAAQPTLHSSFT